MMRVPVVLLACAAVLATAHPVLAQPRRPPPPVPAHVDPLVAEAKRLSPDCIALLVNSDNARAIRFYARNGFVHAGEDVNPTSGRPVLRMEWKANQGDVR